MKYLFTIFCFVLCSCFSEEKQLLFELEPCSSSSVEPNPLILECPPEDIAQCPLLKSVPNKRYRGEGGGWYFALSVEELSFGKQGMVRCVTASGDILGISGNAEAVLLGCRHESIIVSDSINNPPRFIGINRFKRLVCPWFTATIPNDLYDRHILHILVEQNETGNEREMPIFVTYINSASRLTITQSAE